MGNKRNKMQKKMAKLEKKWAKLPETAVIARARIMRAAENLHAKIERI